jgi:hypothetical protein
MIEPHYLWHSKTCFCPCNAARDRGAHIQMGIQGFRSLYAETSPGIPFSRARNHLPSAPTDIQAEVLLKDPIPLDSITAIAVQSELQARQEICRLNLQGIAIDKPIFIVPEFYDRALLSRKIQNGVRVSEQLHMNGGLHG